MTVKRGGKIISKTYNKRRHDYDKIYGLYCAGMKYGEIAQVMGGRATYNQMYEIIRKVKMRRELDRKLKELGR